MQARSAGLLLLAMCLVLLPSRSAVAGVIRHGAGAWLEQRVPSHLIGGWTGQCLSLPSMLPAVYSEENRTGCGAKDGTSLEPPP